MADGPKGPASYFPSIEAKYGRSIAEWKALMRSTGLQTHKELVAWLKQEHGFGHGHAAAITSDLLDEGTPRLTANEQVDRLFPDTGSLRCRPQAAGRRSDRAARTRRKLEHHDFPPRPTHKRRPGRRRAGRLARAGLPGLALVR